ncbi:hypothetical protein ACFQI7_33490 [Paenibacillus allorhizosphaerae]|uniref:Uncharacterized protein n=1 Tax=Paenibacillus allorhizosphaerae TaxID=2849866 RepID=A0ABM8VQI0_9BACL|nr:hypothetical protein [Paenibacillus allorhizosphaerae]CAG7654253.1 hypothetical protein PAECIP111802_05716 [Paenibacillus allorhizosphaerae]
MKKYAIFIVAIIFLVTTGCGRLDLIIHEDGSGGGEYTIELTGKFSAQDVWREIDKSIEKTNKAAGNFKLNISVKECASTKRLTEIR